MRYRTIFEYIGIVTVGFLCYRTLVSYLIKVIDDSFKLAKVVNMRGYKFTKKRKSKTLLAVVMLACPQPNIIGFDKSKPYTQREVAEISFMSKQCPEHFPKSPCTISITKVSEHNYHVICGVPK